MKRAGIPQTVEVRTLAARQVVIEGGLTEARMPRLAAAIASADAPAQVRVDCSRDEEGTVHCCSEREYASRCDLPAVFDMFDHRLAG